MFIHATEVWPDRHTRLLSLQLICELSDDPGVNTVPSYGELTQSSTASALEGDQDVLPVPWIRTFSLKRLRRGGRESLGQIISLDAPDVGHQDYGISFPAATNPPPLLIDVTSAPAGELEIRVGEWRGSVWLDTFERLSRDTTSALLDWHLSELARLTARSEQLTEALKHLREGGHGVPRMAT